MFGEDRCFFCNGEVEYKQIVYGNTKWGTAETVEEEAVAYVCKDCGEIVFDYEEAVRLEKLSQGYK